MGNPTDFADGDAAAKTTMKNILKRIFYLDFMRYSIFFWKKRARGEIGPDASSVYVDDPSARWILGQFVRGDVAS